MTVRIVANSTEALAEAWASIDGKRRAFIDGMMGEDKDGYYEGYLSDADELEKRLAKLGYIIRKID